MLKENYTFLVADADGHVRQGEKGVYDRDTRFLRRYEWSFGEPYQTLVAHTPRPNVFVAHYAKIDGPEQTVGVQRTLTLYGKRLVDRLRIENTSLESQDVMLRLEARADFIDLFAARGWFDRPETEPEGEVEVDGFSYAYVASDGIEQAVRIAFDVRPDGVDSDAVTFELHLDPKASIDVGAEVSFTNPVDEERPTIDLEEWRASFHDLTATFHSPAVAQAVDDLRSLLLFTDAGPVPAAGIPWFVAAFGRDSLITAHLLLPHRPDVSEGTIRFLAAHQATADDEFRVSEPGKILHELRYGEYARTGVTPHAPYYGTVDATPLFVMLLDAHARATGSDDLVRELAPAWEAALAWMTGPADLRGEGFLEFMSSPQEAGTGLTVQSWKDSSDAMSHVDGSLATGAIAVSEVQGYAYAAYRAAAGFYARMGRPGDADAWNAHAERLQAAFHERFWMPERNTYAMALDGDGRPLEVKSSDAGQLLWTGIVPESHAERLRDTLFADTSFTGWGFRTLANDEVRFNPVSYHNGSVWPHDTALIAVGLERYGFHEDARRVARAVLDLAEDQPDRRLPELIAGYPRTEAPPVPYPVACRPQAWDAAAVVCLARMVVEDGGAGA